VTKNYNKQHNPPAMPGRSKPRARAIMSMSAAMREVADSEVLAMFLWAILEGKDPKVCQYEDGSWGIEYEERGAVAPTLDQKMRAAAEIMNRGWGTPAQTIQLDQQIRLDATANLPKGAGALSVAQLGVMRAAIRGQLAPPPASVIDADSVDGPSASEHEGSNKAPDGPASTDHGTSSGDQR